ncbi:hypothetical protein A2U01_0038887, partial [Trifolium medium]|nr:hypothetical protein [Trifolium medium]
MNDLSLFIDLWMLFTWLWTYDPSSIIALIVPSWGNGRVSLCCTGNHGGDGAVISLLY